jgi:hypothetical protein
MIQYFNGQNCGDGGAWHAQRLAPSHPLTAARLYLEKNVDDGFSGAQLFGNHQSPYRRHRN